MALNTITFAIHNRYTNKPIYHANISTDTPISQRAYVALEQAVRDCADLRFANLSDVDLRGANLSGAYLSGADLRGADLSDVENLSLTATAEQAEATK